MPINADADFLAHHGVPKQKWGERRYQNKDGSLTPLGREHRRLTRPSRAGKSEDKKKKPSLKEVYAASKAKKAAAKEAKAEERRKAVEARETAKLEKAANEARERSEKERAGIEEIRKKVLVSKDPKYIMDNLQYLDNNEVSAMATRLEKQANIQKYIPKEQTPLDKFNEKLTKFNDAYAASLQTANNVNNTLRVFGINVGDDVTKALSEAAKQAAANSSGGKKKQQNQNQN